MSTTMRTTMELVLITGMSGSGKSVALHALEDAGFYCVDNLPPELLLPFIDLEQDMGVKQVAIAMDIRSASSLPSTALRANSVAMVPGATALTRMPCGASASAITRVSWSMPPLLTL